MKPFKNQWKTAEINETLRLGGQILNTHQTHTRGRRNSGRSGPATDTVPIRFGLGMKMPTNAN